MALRALFAAIVFFAGFACGPYAALAQDAFTHELALAGLNAPGKTMTAVVTDRLKGFPYRIVAATAITMRLQTTNVGYARLLADRRIVRVAKLGGADLPDPTARVTRAAYTLRLVTDGEDPIRFTAAVPPFTDAALLGTRVGKGLPGPNAAGLPLYGIEVRAVDAAGAVRGRTVIEDPRILRYEPATPDGRHLTSATFRKSVAIVTVEIAVDGPVRRLELFDRRGTADRVRRIGTVVVP